MQALQTIVSRKIPPGAGVVVSVTEFISDGQRNILAGRCLLKGDVRTRSEQDRMIVEAFMRKISTGIGQAHDVCVEVKFNTEFIETINAVLPTSAVVRTANALGLETIGDREPMSFSEDFAHFNNVVPGCLLLMGNGQDGPSGQPLHANNYDFNDALLPIGVEFWSALVKDRLTVWGKVLNKHGISLCLLLALKNLVSMMNDYNTDIALITNEDNIYYLTGYYDYLHMDFGRPTL